MYLAAIAANDLSTSSVSFALSLRLAGRPRLLRLAQMKMLRCAGRRNIAPVVQRSSSLFFPPFSVLSLLASRIRECNSAAVNAQLEYSALIDADRDALVASVS
jgi:hypothetical protein